MDTQPKQPKRKKPVHEDHRSRMRAKVKEYGLASFAEHEALEYVLFFAIPRQNTNPIAHALLDRFGSFADVLEADEKELVTVPGVGPATAHFLHTLTEIDRYYLTSRSKVRRRLSSTVDIVNYLVPLFRGAKQEKLLMLALDDRRQLLRTIWLEEGSASGVDMSVRRIAAEAVRAGAAYVVLAHNHPDGNVLPSRQDLFSTNEAARALALLQVRLLDHIILAGDETLSLNETGRMPPVRY